MIHSSANRAKFLVVLVLGNLLLTTLYIQEPNQLIQSLEFAVIIANGVLGTVWILYSQYREYSSRVTEVKKPKPINTNGFESSLTFSTIMDRYYRQRLAKYPRGQYVYVLKDIDVSGMYKIGKTNYPASRIGRFDVRLPFRIHIIAIIPCENMHAFESNMHRSYQRQRGNGEWFLLSDEDLSKLIPLEMRHGNWNEYSEGIAQ